MTSFYLSNKDRKLSPIVMYVSFKTLKFSKYIGESVESSAWSTKKQRCKVTANDVDAELLNERLDKWENAVARTENYFKDVAYVPNKEEFIKRMEDERYEKNPNKKHISFVEYCDIFKERYEKVRSKNRIYHYASVKNMIEEYQQEKGYVIYFENIDQDFYNDFKHWFLEEKQRSLNYFGETIKTIKLIFNEAKSIDKIHNSDGANGKKFTAPQVDVDNIYLNEEELLMMHRLVITDELVEEEHPNLDRLQIEMRVSSLQKARDMFLIGAYTGLRYSDIASLTSENVSDIIKVYANKTDIKSIIPVHWVVKEIFERGYDFDNILLEKDLNKHIKEVAKLAGLTEEVMVYKNKGGKQVKIVGPKYSMVSTHTGRRSFATNAYKAKIPTVAIMKITGHKRESTFMKYIKVNEEENAEMLQSHDFFTKKQ